MKLKNLFLASIAVAALTACSNETEFIDNGNQTIAKDASMQFSIALPQGSLTRAGSTDVGLDTENTFADITVVLDYGANRSIFTVGYGDFNNANGKLTLKSNLSVTAGENVNVYAFVNASSALKDQLGSAPINTLRIDGNYNQSIDDLTNKGGIAEANNFLMSGSQPSQKINAGEVNKVTVSVDRVAAKLVEKSKTEAFVIKKPQTSTANDDELKITLTNYNFANLQQDTYVLENGSNIVSSTLFNAYSSEPFSSWDNDYLTPKKITGDLNHEINNSNITYCTENKDRSTLVLYKAVATWGDNQPSNFYVDASNTVYLSFEELSKRYDTGLTDESSIEEFSIAGIKKYEDGVCYYKSNEIGAINRNNVYYLNVSNITKLGDPTPGVTPNPSTIDLEVSIKPWTINNVDIIL